jgi:hypothetical protein
MLIFQGTRGHEVWAVSELRECTATPRIPSPVRGVGWNVSHRWTGQNPRENTAFLEISTQFGRLGLIKDA